MKNDMLLTIVFTAHLNVLKHIEYVNFVSKFAFKNNVNVIYMFDNEVTPEEEKFLNDKLDKRTKFYSGKNKGKLKSLVNISNKIDTRFVKTLDHDDSIDFRKLKKINNFLSKLKKEEKYFLVHPATKIFKDSPLYGSKLKTRGEIRKSYKYAKDVNWAFVPHAKAMFETSFFKTLNDNYDLIHRIDYFDDNLLSSLAELWADKAINMNIKFYLQNHGYGHSSTLSNKKAYDLNNFYVNLYNISSLEPFSNLKNLNCDENCQIGYINWRVRNFAKEKIIGFDSKKSIEYIEKIFCKGD